MARGIVSVYGGSHPLPGSEAYEEARTLGALLAEAGYSVATGGYGGTMEATSRGAAEAGGHVIGVTSSIFDKWRGSDGANEWVNEEIKHVTLRERMMHLIDFCDAAVTLRGGIGTLAELAVTWSFLQTGEIKPRPFVLLGSEWAERLTRFYGDGAYIDEAYMSLWQCVDTPQQAVAALETWAAAPDA